MPPATLTHSPSAPSSITLQSILSQHADQPNSALSSLITEFNRITAQLATAQARLAEFDAGKTDQEEMVRSRHRLQDENRQLWAVISKCKADLRDLKNENRDLKHRLAELEQGLGPGTSGRLTPGVSPAPATTPDLHQLASESHRPSHTPADPRRASESSTTNPRQPVLSESSPEKTPPAESRTGLLQLSFESPFKQALSPASLPAEPQPSPGRLPPSPRLRRRASSVDVTRSPSSPAPPLPGTPPRNAKDRPGNPIQLSLDSPPDRAASQTHPPHSPAPLSTHHSVIPPEIRQYVLGNPSPISPLTLTHPTSPDQPVSSELSASTELGPTAANMTSTSLPNPSLSSSLSSHHALSTNPSTSHLAQPAHQPRTSSSEPNPSSAALASSSASLHGSASPHASQRHPKPPNSPTQSQHGPASNSGTSAHSSSSVAPVPPPAPPPPSDSVYTTQPMTKRRMLTPAFLPFTRIKVTNSHIRANDKSKEVISFSITISVVIPPESDPEGKGAKASWVVEKLYSDVLSLDHVVKSKHSKVQNRSLAQLPDRALFKDHAPSKVDARKAVLQKYLQSLCAAQLTEKADVCDFFNSNIVITERNSTVTRPGFMQGYLTKKGRNFGGWQTRFYVLEGPILEYFDTRGGNRLGHIAVTGAQIGRQQYRSQEANDDSYRHAFLIRMHKREKEGDIDHILCAETDEERDAWVDALTCYVTGRYLSAEQAAAASAAAGLSSSTNSMDTPRRENLGLSASQSDSRISRRQTSLDTSLRAEPPHPHNPHHQASSSYDQPVRLHRGSHQHSKTEAADQTSLTSDGGSIRGTASTIAEESVPANVANNSISESIPRAESLDAIRPDGREKDHHNISSRPPHLDARASAYSPPGGLPGPSTPRPTLSQQTRLVQAQSHSSPQQESLASDADSIVTAERPSTPDSQQRPRISGPMNGAPITGGYRIKPPEEKKAKFKSAFWGFTSRNGITGDRNNNQHPAPSNNTNAFFTPAPRPVFGVSLQEAVSVARVHEGLDLPAVVFRCVEYLEAKGAIEEEGIYRLSGSSVNIKSYKERFNTEGDYNLLESSTKLGEYHDVHAVAGLLKQFLRELASPILTRELHSEFLKVIDLSQRSDKVNELGRLCSELPLPNYTLLRFLSAHLIHIVQNEKINKMSMRNVGIVFSPTLGMPAPLFALLLKEFDLVFNIEGDNRAPIRLTGNNNAVEQLALPPTTTSDETANNASNSQKRVSRNSMLYAATGADMLMEHNKLPRGKPALNDESDSDVDYDSSSEPDQPTTTEINQHLINTPSVILQQQKSPLRRRASLEVHSPLVSPSALPSSSSNHLLPSSHQQRSQNSLKQGGIINNVGVGLAPRPVPNGGGRVPSPRPRTAGQ